MLSDDITGGIGAGFRAMGSVIGGAVRGTFMGAALTFLGVSVAEGVIGAMGAFSAGAGFGGAAVIGAVAAAHVAGGIIAGAGAAIAAGSLAAAAGTFLPLVLAGAAIGAAVIGITSIIPGISEGFGLKGLFQQKEAPAPAPECAPACAPQQQPVVQHITQQCPEPQQPRVIVVHDNPYYQPGKGMELMQRGDATIAPAQTTCR